MRSLFAIVVVLALAACESTPTRLLTYGSQGVEIQALRLVAAVYGRPADPLPYGGADIDTPVARMLARSAQLRPYLDQGALGLTEEGGIAVRDAASLSDAEASALRSLVGEENFDRALLYRTMCKAVGYGPHLLPFTEDTFGAEWARQAPAGWWLRDHKGRWLRKA